MSDAGKAVFLSYARDDIAAARRIADALRASGLEVWFDENELRGGDSWDARIRRQIDTCALFVPIISTHTQHRNKGYFRLEWKLAVDETGLLAEGVPFIVPVAIDDTPESEAVVPGEFLKVQWMRLPGALPTPQFVEQIARLLHSEAKPSVAVAHNEPHVGDPAVSTRLPRWTWVAAAVALATVAFFVLRPRLAGTESSAQVPAAAVTEPAHATNTRSVAVLAFADLSEGGNSGYLSDGISEELLNVLAKVPGLRVAARTSSFYFKGRNLPVPEIATKLGVAYVIEGSVQRAGDRVKITAQMIKADGFHVWSDTFVRELKDVFAVQEEIARLIADNLELKLGAASGAEATADPRAVELYLRAQQGIRQRTTVGFEDAEKLLPQALQMDPGLARARAALADVWILHWDSDDLIGQFGQRNSPRIAEIRAEIDRALAIDPNLAEAHAALGNLYLEEWKFQDAAASLRRAIALNPNYASAHHWLARTLVSDGRLQEGIDELSIAAMLDPLSHRILDNLGNLLDKADQTEQALVINERALGLQPDSDQALAFKALYLDKLGRHAEALESARRAVAMDPFWQDTLYGVFIGAGRKAEADAWPARSEQVASLSIVRYAAAGQPDAAFARMDPNRVSWRDVGQLLYSRQLDPIRADPRFSDLIARFGLTEPYARARSGRR